MSATAATLPTVCVYPQQQQQPEQQQQQQERHRQSSPNLHNHQLFPHTSQHHSGFSQPQNQSKIVVLWSSEDGRTQTSVKPDQKTTARGTGNGNCGGAAAPVGDGGSRSNGDGWKPLPFQYQIPINKYSTLHSIAIKRSSFKRRQSDLAAHRATIAVPRILLDACNESDRPGSSSPLEDCQKSSAGNDEVDSCADTVKSAVTSSVAMTSQSAGGRVHSQPVPPSAASTGDRPTSAVGGHQVIEHTTASSADELRKRVELLDEKNAITDLVIRQLSEQIARLQSTTNPVTVSAISVAATSASTTASVTASTAASANRKNSEVKKYPSADDTTAAAREVKKTKEVSIQVDLVWPAVITEHSGLQSADKVRFQSFQDLTSASAAKLVDDEQDVDDVKPSTDALHDKLLACRLREATMLGHLKDYRRRIDELNFLREMHEAQILRLNEEMTRLRQVLVECRGKEKETQSLITDLRLSLADLQRRLEEQTMLSQLRDVEHRETTEELLRKVTQLESEKQRLINALQSTGAAGYYAVAHCTAQADRQRIQQQRNQLQQQQHQQRLHRNVNNESIEFYDYYDEDDEDEYAKNPLAAQAVSASRTALPAGGMASTSADGNVVDDISGGRPELDHDRRSSVAPPASTGDVKIAAVTAQSVSISKTGNLKPNSTPPPVSRGIRRIDPNVNGDESPGTSRRNVDARDVPLSSDISRPPGDSERSLMEGSAGNSRQRVSFCVNANDSSTSMSKISNVASSNNSLPVAPSTSDTTSSSFPVHDRLPVNDSIGSHQRQRPVINSSSNTSSSADRIPVGNAMVVHATIESRQVSPGRKWMQSYQNSYDDTDAGALRPATAPMRGHYLPTSSATMPRRTKTKSGSGGLIHRPVNGGERPFDVMTSSCESSESMRDVHHAGVDGTTSIKSAVTANFNHARLIGDELVIFNGYD